MKLKKECVYGLSELTDKQMTTLLFYLKTNDNDWELTNEKDFKKDLDNSFLFFAEETGWTWTHEKPTTNAKELFYTLENIQVDCRELSEEQIKEMASVFEKTGYKMCNPDNDLSVTKRSYFLSCEDGYFIVFNNQNKNTITYEKFMELFGPQYEVKMIVEAPKPQHYSKGIDTFARMEANCTKEECLAFAKGNIDKYNFRTKGQDLEDYKKIVS